jgi:AraC-like DNA-binding protein
MSLAVALVEPKRLEFMRPGAAVSLPLGDANVLPRWLAPSMPLQVRGEHDGANKERKQLPNIIAFTGGVFFTDVAMSMRDVARRAVTILISAREEPFELGIKGKSTLQDAVLISPLTRHSVVAGANGALCLMVTPDNALYRAFSDLKQGATLRLARSSFSEWAADLSASISTDFSTEQAQALFHNIVGNVAGLFAPPPPLDCRVEEVMRLVRSQPDASLDDLAAAVGLSYHRLSHLFAKSIGLPLRSYQVWQKGFYAAQLLKAGYTLAEVAARSRFTDAEHLCRFYREVYGASPSYVYGKRMAGGDCT